MPSQSCPQPIGSPHQLLPGWGHGEAEQSLGPAPQSGSPGGGSGRLGPGDSGASGCGREQARKKETEALSLNTQPSPNNLLLRGSQTASRDKARGY